MTEMSDVSSRACYSELYLSEVSGQRWRPLSFGFCVPVVGLGERFPCARDGPLSGLRSASTFSQVWLDFWYS